MQFIDEQHNATALTGSLAATAIGLAHLLQHGPQPFLELAAELGAGDQGAEIQRHQPQTPQGIGHLAGNDALGQGFGHGGLADAGLTDQHRIVLAAARQHLDQAPDLRVPTDHRIKAAVAGGGGEIAAEALQR